LGGATTPLPIVNYVNFRKGYIQIPFFLGKIGTLIVLKLWTPISSSKQTFLEYVREVSYSPQKYLSNGVLQVQIKDHSTLALMGFVVGNQTPNLIPDPSFDHNSCI
jgi:hypothetical protein